MMISDDIIPYLIKSKFVLKGLANDYGSIYIVPKYYGIRLTLQCGTGCSARKYWSLICSTDHPNRFQVYKDFSGAEQVY
ncbi:hypothetical protein DASC09_011530 [Saccharomycopsis crataegensis]|uniref:Homing endonuclease LAGLIDADG domain-containing protein n=1 Tax=Saccharomycopsis crataegensis TaxID=43959 RepID=A0AAV5QG63_9ASCO|nr:hypothetical protein DASC09_011530 [Saccharomycopsis crataegensis]